MYDVYRRGRRQPRELFAELRSRLARKEVKSRSGTMQAENIWLQVGPARQCGLWFLGEIRCAMYVFAQWPPCLVLFGRHWGQWAPRQEQFSGLQGAGPR